MSKNNLIWLFIISFIATCCIWLFNGSLFSVCYSMHPELLNFHLLIKNPTANCILYGFAIAFGALFCVPTLVTLLFYGIYVLIFNRAMAASHYIIWFVWFIALYYITFQVDFLPLY